MAISINQTSWELLKQNLRWNIQHGIWQQRIRIPGLAGKHRWERVGENRAASIIHQSMIVHDLNANIEHVYQTMSKLKVELEFS